MIVLPYKSEVDLRGLPFITMGLIMVNILVHLLVQFQSSLFFYDWGFAPYDYRPLNLITSMFLHGGILHLLFNMWFLWVFGPAVEGGMGSGIFLPAYMLFGISAALIHSLNTPASMIDVPCVGASGAISGVMGAFLVMYPRGLIKHFIFVFVRGYMVSLPAWLTLGMWFIEQGVMSFYISDYTSVAVFAHIGGFAVGGLFGFVFGGKKSAPVKLPAGKSADSKSDPYAQYCVLKATAEREPLDLKLRHAVALAAARAGDAPAALEESKYLYHRFPEHELRRRFDLRLLQTALGQPDNTAKGIFELAEGFYLSNHHQRACELYQQVLNGWPDYPKRAAALVRVGDILVNHLDRPTAAGPYLEEAVKGDPRSALAQEAQGLLKKMREMGVI